MGKQGRSLLWTLLCSVLLTSDALVVPSSLRFRSRHTISTASPTDDVVSTEPSVLDRPAVTIPTTVEQENELISYQPEETRRQPIPVDHNDVVGGSGIVIIAGFENFNIQLYRKAAALVTSNVPSVPVSVFTDADIAERPDEVERALRQARVVFCSLIVDFLQVQWVRQRITHIPIRFMFESALELMSETKVGNFEMKGSGGKAAGPPAPIKALLKQFGSGREEDRMSGYIKFLKIGPKLLKYIPGDKAKDLKTWLTVYSYWSEGAAVNVESMLYTIINAFQLSSTLSTRSISAGEAVGGSGVPPVSSITISSLSESLATPTPQAVVEYPQQGLFHPDLVTRSMEWMETEKRTVAGTADADAVVVSTNYMSSPKEYCRWYEATHPWVTPDTPRVGILLYRKHVITEQGYIPNLIKLMESNNIMPIPVFISGIEGHTIVRDLFTTHHEQQQRRAGILSGITLRTESARVDAVVNTIGFPLVGGPAGSMEGGRQIEAAKEILSAKNVPYFVAAPLLIQDAASWQKGGVQGLQTVVLYALPELDGAIETVVLGGLVGGDKIIVMPERVRRLANRLKAWVRLRQTPPADRRLSILLYGFPPNVGAVGTAALLNVGNSLRNLFGELAREGYDLGLTGGQRGFEKDFGDRLVSASRALLQGQIFAGGGKAEDKRARAQVIVDGIMKQDSTGGGQGGGPIVKVVLVEVDTPQLRSWLGKDAAGRMEKHWGELERYSDVGVAGSAGTYGVVGLQVGHVFVGVQPLVGVEGDPMRLLFEKDLTPHPQYAAYYKWMNKEYNPHVMIHFGMHGTVEWLPGSPLGSTADSWPDMLLGDAPNLYVYACNNPSESLLAKRRGYATVVSHNVPPYARAGLYKELSGLRDLLNELRVSSVEQGAMTGKSSPVADSTETGLAAGSASAQEPGLGQGQGQGFIPVPNPVTTKGRGVITATTTTAATMPSASIGSSGKGSSSADSTTSGSGGGGVDVIPLIAAAAEKCGIYDDLPYDLSFADPLPTPTIPTTTTATTATTTTTATVAAKGMDTVSGLPQGVEVGVGKPPRQILSSERATELLAGPHATAFAKEFDVYAGRLRGYLGELEQRLFSEGLHEMGSSLSSTQILGYLDACFGEEETGVHGDTLRLLAEGVVEIRDQQMASSARGRGSVVWSGAPSSSLLLRAESLQRDREKRKKQSLEGGDDSRASSVSSGENSSGGNGIGSDVSRLSPVQDAWQGIWSRNDRIAKETGRGVDWRNLATEDDKFAWALLREKDGWKEFLTYQWLRWCASWGSMDAQEQLNQLIAIGLTSPAKISLSGAATTSAEYVLRALKLAQLLADNPHEEMRSLVRGIGGEFVLPAPGGDVIRDGVGVLPTGRNIHALDPYRIPSEVAMARGRTAARLIIETHQRSAAVAAITGREKASYPETIAVTLWGLDTIKTKGESIAIVLALVGAEPIREGTGRVVGFALTPLSELGRPRIDVLGSLSGIFRDSFGNVLDLLDEMFEKASYNDEPEDMNFIKKHTAALTAKGVERPFSRLFSNPPGDFGSLVNEQIGSGEWGESKELGNTWQNRNSFSYGRQSASVGSQMSSSSSSSSSLSGGGIGSNVNGNGGNGLTAEKGQFRPEVLSSLLSTTDRIVQEIDSVEYGLTDIQEYYANTGALKKAAENNGVAGRKVSVSVIESFEKEVKPRDLEETLRLEYRSKLLNPKWAEAMVAQGAGGAYEISGRMTAMIGWAATTDFAEQWVFDGAADRYVLDENMADRLKKQNPEAFRNILKRMLEAKGRGFWTPSDDVLAKLQDMFEEIEDEIEGI